MKALILATGLSLSSAAFAQNAGLDAWEQVYEVFSHPRCANCHVGADNIPIWSGPHYGKTRVHGMHITAGSSRDGSETLNCRTCHQEHNAEILHGAPGAEVWHLPPVEMEWFGKTSAQVCNQSRDPSRNGNRSVADLAEHVSHDALVLWGWEPGLGRTPAPGTPEELAQALRVWGEYGTPCPDD